MPMCLRNYGVVRFVYGFYLQPEFLIRRTLLIVLLLFVPGVIFSQSPGGAILWLVGDSIPFQNGSKIAGWADLSGKSNSVTQNNPFSQPSLISNIINGHAAVKFHGGGEFFSGPAVFPVGKDYTISAV